MSQLMCRALPTSSFFPTRWFLILLCFILLTSFKVKSSGDVTRRVNHFETIPREDDKIVSSGDERYERTRSHAEGEGFSSEGRSDQGADRKLLERNLVRELRRSSRPQNVEQNGNAEEALQEEVVVGVKEREGEDQRS